MKKIIRFLAVLSALLIAIILGLVACDFFQTQGKFPTYSFIGQINVSGLTQPQANEKLNRFTVATAFSPILAFEAENRSFPLSPEAAGITLNVSESVRHAFSLTHDEGYLKELKTRLIKGRLRSPLIFNVNDGLFKEQLEKIASELRSTSKEASIILYEETGGYHIEPEEAGKEVNIPQTLTVFKQKLEAGEKKFPLIIDYIQPRVTEKDLRAFPPAHRLSAFTTYYGRHDSPNRIHNIKLIASWLEGRLIMPEEEISLSNEIGDFTPERGFKEAYVIYGGVLVPQLGGGTCQIGTTLFNALALADIQILSRQNHSFYFNIYPLGRDATVYPGQKDLKFKNDTGHPILIKTVATNRRLSFRIFGTPTGKSAKFSAPAVYLLTASGYRPAGIKEVLASDRPFRTSVTRTVFDAAGKKIKEEILHSAYKLYGEKSNVPIARPEPR